MKKPRPEANPPPVDLVQRNIETVARMKLQINMLAETGPRHGQRPPDCPERI